MRVLVCNDDGARAPGIAALAAVARTLTADVWVVGPERKWTAASHQITFDVDLTLTRLDTQTYACSGAPADGVIAALHVLLANGALPDLVLSGINDKRNVAEDVAYSGTMAIAREAAFAGIPAIALSRDLAARKADDGDQVARLVHFLWMHRATWQAPRAWLSVNLPARLPARMTAATIGRDKIGAACDVIDASPERIVYRNRRGRAGSMSVGDENAVLAAGEIAIVRHDWGLTAPIDGRLTATWNAAAP